MDDMDELIKKYFKLGYSQVEIAATLTSRYNINLSVRQLQRELQRLELYRHKNQTDMAQVRRFIERQLQASGELHGYRWMHHKLLQAGMVASRETVRRTLLELDPDGVNLRKRRRLVRRRYSGRGPNFVWHLDAMDKLKPFGIGISGCIDGFSRKIIWLEANSTTNDPEYIGGFFLKAVDRLGGCPTLVRSDRGTENGHVGAFQRFLRHHDDALGGDKSYLTGRSTANQRIESWWGQLRKQCTEFWRTLFRWLLEEGFFTGDVMDKELIRFVFMKHIQGDLDAVAEVWDGHLIRKSKQEHVTHGRPLLMFQLPEVYGTRDHLKPVEQERIDLCREECNFKDRFPCDRELFEYCCQSLITNGWEDPRNPEAAMNLYINLREHVRREIGV
ncbi:uncharacterized protein LOC119719823 [Patiria miniata]|uniref:Integrase core domain-containing protein n=1 Tax=Patiria miniata TaxID=46514 RepID=A0A913Z2M1_PATMI|nr:uncharacterized protein LOC119719823 [Patiria miniata]